VNIDAMPGSMRAFRRERPRDINLEMGVTAHRETCTLFVFDEPALNTFDASRASKLDRPPYRIVSRTPVSCAPLAEILAAHAIDQVDLLTVDAEGLDLDVVKSLDWARHHPHVVLLEHHAHDLAAVLDSELHAFVRAKGYDLVAKTFNSLFYVAREA
jgi:FkbM family methyltransferase